jgi:photosystem II stability/assembly factor-like uncharacterized protein
LVRSTDHGQTWETIAINPPGTSGPMIYNDVVESYGSTVYVGSDISGGMARSDDDGLTFQPLAGSPNPSVLQILSDGHVLVDTSGLGVYRSVDSGVTWQFLTSVTYFRLPVLEDASGRLVYIDDGGVTRYSTDQGDSWNEYPNPTLPSAGGLPVVDGTGRLVVDLAPMAAMNATFGPPAMTYTSTDGGATWTSLIPQLPNPYLIGTIRRAGYANGITGFAVDKQGRLLAATAGGLYRLDGLSAGP